MTFLTVVVKHRGSTDSILWQQNFFMFHLQFLCFILSNPFAWSLCIFESKVSASFFSVWEVTTENAEKREFNNETKVDRKESIPRSTPRSAFYSLQRDFIWRWCPEVMPETSQEGNESCNEKLSESFFIFLSTLNKRMKEELMKCSADRKEGRRVVSCNLSPLCHYILLHDKILCCKLCQVE